MNRVVVVMAVGCLAGCRAPAAVPAARPATVPEPKPAAWVDGCERLLRDGGTRLLSAGLPGPVLTQRERATDWGAADYDAFIGAAATNWKLFPDPPVVAEDAAPTDGLVFALGRSMKFRVVLIPIACKPRNGRLEPWFDKQKYWDPDELDMQSHGVSVALHTDPADPARSARFIGEMKPIVEACLASHPDWVPDRDCDPVPG